MPAVNISKNQPCKAKGLGGVFPLRSKNAALLYMYRLVFRTTSIPLILVKMEIAPFFNATDGYLSFEPSLITLRWL